ncbi:Peptidase U32 [Acididesulfobacillus acetoxydans]|uniref:Collagenase-like protease n=1 Tax=Acididesulfobacillus acetoxydans TaxID=1561005 RepID=A0A8S0Y1U2_9FIRM|nr:U32 family peptidase [Acididesulfobacillus acetoxydans]CAA7599965.1 Peptidase U32 [Acididesulfobacillus acetoxydans]CEJ07943.1 Collagenase-like protease [Acididesulfobacillus acetoxydans]
MDKPKDRPTDKRIETTAFAPEAGGGHLELLAPAGSWEAFKAAVENGADAVYLGGKSFNARAGAANFGPEELRSAVQYAHERRVKVYVTVNILVADREFPELIEYLYALYSIGADAVILQDPGVAWLMRHIMPEMEIHASTQMTVNTHWGVRRLESMGFARAVLARELSAREMAEICAATPLAIEVFVHGALCICYSGQCLMSSFIGGRSGNRGTCAQPCRLSYTLVDRAGQDVLAGANLGDHLLSPRDLNLAEELGQLRTIGVDSLKIEGRMKRPEYVATVTRIYRRALRRLERVESERVEGSGDSGLLEPEERRELTQIFNRDFTQAYFLSHPGAELMSYKRPNNRGTRLGRVKSSGKGRLFLKLESELNQGDGVEIWTGQGHEGLSVTGLRVAGHSVSRAQAGDVVELEFNGRSSPGDRVFKTHDAVLMEKARRSFQEGKEERRYPLTLTVRGKAGVKLELEASGLGRRLVVHSGGLLENARQRPLTVDYLRRQLGRLGTTPFFLETLQVDLEGDVILPVSELNELRRSAVAGLLAGEESGTLRLTPDAYLRRVEKWTQRLRAGRRAVPGTGVRLVSVAVADSEGLEGALEAGAGRILLGGERWRSQKGFSPEEVRRAVERCHKLGVESVWRLPRILNEGQSADWLKILKQAALWEIRPVLMVANLGELEMVKTLDPDWPLEADYALNVFNGAGIDYFLREEVRVITLSPELHHEQIGRLAGGSHLEMLVFGDLEMMVSEYCPIGAALGGKKGETCTGPCRQGPYFLRDRLKYDFPLETDWDCRMHLFNVKILNLYGELGQIAAMGIKKIRLQLVRSDRERVRQVVSLFRAAWEKGDPEKQDAKDVEKNLQALAGLYPQGFTKGHFFRGIL